MIGDNVPKKNYFIKWYKERSWRQYTGLLATCIRFGVPGKWLDLGCGTGYFTECANRFGIDCIGLDGSEDAVKIAKDRCPDLNIKQHFLEEKLPFADSSITTIMCNQVIEHLSSEVASCFLTECNRVLVPHGVIFIYSPCIYNKKERLLDETHINLYTPRSLKMELERNGFKVVLSPNSPMKIFGDNIIAEKIIILIYKLFPIDYISASANCIAKKIK